MNDQLEKPEYPTAADSAAPAPGEATSGNAANSSAGELRPTAPAGGKPPRGPVKKRKAVHKRRVPRPSPAAGAAPVPHAVHHYDKLVDEGDDEGPLGRHRTKIVIGAVALLGAGIFYFLGSAKHTANVKAPEKVMTVSLQPLPPPPPPPPPPPKREPPPPKPEEKMVQESAPVEKPKEAPKAPEPPKEALGTGVKGNGPGIAGLGVSGNGGGFGGPQSGGGSKWGYYAGMVQSKVSQALQSNSRTRMASMQIQVRIWPDPTGRITRAKLDASTGDPKLDAAIQNDVLTNLQLDQPPPPGMPLPIVMRLTARKH